MRAFVLDEPKSECHYPDISSVLPSRTHLEGSTVERMARCQCGQLSITVSGSPTLVTACNCSWCQRRSGSIFSVASRWTLDQVKKRTGTSKTFERPGSSGGRVVLEFCGDCGSTVATKLDAMPGVIGIPVGAFFDPTFPAPNVVVWCDSKAEWMEFPGGVLQLPDQTPPVATR